MLSLTGNGNSNLYYYLYPIPINHTYVGTLKLSSRLFRDFSGFYLEMTIDYTEC